MIRAALVALAAGCVFTLGVQAGMIRDQREQIASMNQSIEDALIVAKLMDGPEDITFHRQDFHSPDGTAVGGNITWFYTNPKEVAE